MTKCKLEYIWLDGYQPTQSLRSKTKIVEDFSGKVEDAADVGDLTVHRPNRRRAARQRLFVEARFLLPRSGPIGNRVSWSCAKC